MSPTDKMELNKAYYNYGKDATPEQLDKVRWWREQFTKAEKQAAKIANTIKNQWVWVCPVCGTRNYYLGEYCKKSGCLTERVIFQDGNYYAVTWINSIEKERPS